MPKFCGPRGVWATVRAGSALWCSTGRLIPTLSVGVAGSQPAALARGGHGSCGWGGRRGQLRRDAVAVPRG